MTDTTIQSDAGFRNFFRLQPSLNEHSAVEVLSAELKYNIAPQAQPEYYLKKKEAVFVKQPLASILKFVITP
jgi:hypothetical protein